MNGNKHKARIICAILTALMIFSAGAAQTDQSRGADQKQTGSKEQFVIQFSDPLSPAEVIDLVKRTGVTPKELLFEFPGEQDDVITAGYVLNAGEDVGSALQSMVKKHKAFLKEGLSSLNEELSTDSDSVVTTSTKKLKKTFEKMLDDAQKGNFKLKGLKATGGPEVAKLAAIRRIKSVDKVLESERRPDRGEAIEPLFVPASYSHESWAPYYGTAKVNQGLSFQTFFFNNRSAFSSISTYEHETQIYNRSFADFANYWTSNLPSAYLDTSFRDTIDNFTIGTARAANLQNFTKYFTHIALKAGSATTATVRIKGQKGYRDPSWCTSTWCIWPQATTSSMATFTAPIYYTYPYSY
jgi:hypothetical protein